jgi:predicted ArsR family transcriptional regulator
VIEVLESLPNREGTRREIAALTGNSPQAEGEQLNALVQRNLIQQKRRKTGGRPEIVVYYLNTRLSVQRATEL